jgi:hypothetical protein
MDAHPRIKVGEAMSNQAVHTGWLRGGVDRHVKFIAVGQPRRKWNQVQPRGRGMAENLTRGHAREIREAPVSKEREVEADGAHTSGGTLHIGSPETVDSGAGDVGIRRQECTSGETGR